MVLRKISFGFNSCLKRAKQNVYCFYHFGFKIVYIWKKIVVLTSELFVELKDRLDALRRSLWLGFAHNRGSKQRRKNACTRLLGWYYFSRGLCARASTQKTMAWGYCQPFIKNWWFICFTWILQKWRWCDIGAQYFICWNNTFYRRFGIQKHAFQWRGFFFCCAANHSWCRWHRELRLGINADANVYDVGRETWV